MDAINNVYVGIFPLFGILIADEVCCMFFNCMAFDLDWNDGIVSGGILRGELTILIVAFCSQFLV